MNLTLELTGPHASALGAASRKIFAGTGGSIGRHASNAWVLPHPDVSRRHALVRYAGGAYTIEDTDSANGVFVNSHDDRLAAGERCVLKDGDIIFIDPFTIRVALASESLRVASAASDPFSLDDLFGEPSAPPAALPRAGSKTPAPSVAPGELDPLSLLGLDPPEAPAAPRRAESLSNMSAVNEYFRPPAVQDPPAAPAEKAPSLIPENWDVTGTSVIMPSPSVAPPAKPVRPRPVAPGPVRPGDPARGSVRSESGTPPAPVPTPAAAPVAGPAADPSRAVDQGELASLLAGAGLDPEGMTPELAGALGQILRVVVSGVMDVLRARQQIKAEFGLRGTMFGSTDNNPLKFSANVEDALHNLLVKRNPGYLGPVEAFDDAFDDIRNHQMAMLAGIRVAFEAMLSEFDPERLQDEFARQVKKGALISVPVKMRYWELYREKFGDMVRDAEASFAELFGDEFARAYEEQLERLKTRSRSQER